MRYLALATDYDGTLAHDGAVDEPTLAALERLLASGRKAVLVTGRELPDLMRICPRLDLFSLIVAENGALLYRPGNKEERALGPAPPESFVAALRGKGVAPLSVGRCIVATFRPHETVVLETIQALGLELQVIFNKDAVMVLPPGINKASGLSAALKQLCLSAHNVVAVGDAENDHALLAMSECGVAVQNALPALKDRADLVTAGRHGAGVTELIDALVQDDLAIVEGRLRRHHLPLGQRPDGDEVRLPPYGASVLIAGPSGSGKSTVCTALCEALGDSCYQFCLIDPEGDYDGMEGAITLGSAARPPTRDEVLQLLRGPEHSAVVNLVGLPLVDRPPFFSDLLSGLQELRVRTGRPHWIVIDEAHHLLPASWVPGTLGLPRALDRTVLITVHPGLVATAALSSVTHAIAVGDGADETLAELARVLGETPPAVPPRNGDQPGEVVLWDRAGGPPELLRARPSRAEHHRHSRKYAEGELPPERSFYFRGPEGKLRLRAQNLIVFLQMAEGVDDDTWLFHLRQGDYSRWFREYIKDPALGEAAAAVEREALPPDESRARIRAAIERTYTLPASPPLPLPGTAAAPIHDAQDGQDARDARAPR